MAFKVLLVHRIFLLLPLGGLLYHGSGPAAPSCSSSQSSLRPKFCWPCIGACPHSSSPLPCGLQVLQSRAVLSGSQQTRKVLVASPQPWNLQIGQEVHRVVLFNVYLLQVLAVRHVPYIGEDLLAACCEPARGLL